MSDPSTVLPAQEWRARRSTHEARVDVWTAPVLARASSGRRHPVEDFLFTYYSHRPAHLRRWSPGAGVVLAGVTASELDGGSWVDVDGGARLVDPPERVARTASWVRDLLARTAARAPRFGCFGMHEWAMVHGQSQQEVRHLDWPLRLGAEGTTAVVERQPPACSHFDAFRFFAPGAVPLNALAPTRETQGDLEQGGCLHANMEVHP